MITKGIKKYIVNPSLGLLISILYIILFVTTGDIPYSLVVCIILSGVADVLLRIYSKASVCGLIFVLNMCALTLTLIIWACIRKTGIADVLYLIIYETIFICTLIIARLSKTYISLFLGKKKSIVQKTYLSEFFEIAKLSQYGLTLHLFTVLLYRYTQNTELLDDYLDIAIFIIMPIVILLFIIIYEEIKTRNIVKHLRKEEWLPIVNESGEVTGRIAKSVSIKMKNRFLHPVVRVALIHNGEIYLQKRKDDDMLDPSTYDHPFEKYMLFNHEINIAVRNSITHALGMQELPFSFLLKYVYENDITKRLIFLFVSRIENEEQLKSIQLLKGKFWTMKQIEESFNDKDVFSECFQLEYEYLKNTVLQPEILRKQTTT